MTWYTCLHCAPHGIDDHTIYGDKRCLRSECPCPKYEADVNKPIVKISRSRQPSTLTRNIFQSKSQTSTNENPSSAL